MGSEMCIRDRAPPASSREARAPRSEEEERAPPASPPDRRERRRRLARPPRATPRAVGANTRVGKGSGSGPCEETRGRHPLSRDGRSTDAAHRGFAFDRDRDSKSIRTSSRRARSTGLVPAVSSPASSSRSRISPTFSALRAFSVSGIAIGSRSGRRGDVVARQTMKDRETLRRFLSAVRRLHQRAPSRDETSEGRVAPRFLTCRVRLGWPQRQRALGHTRGCVAMRCDV